MAFDSQANCFARDKLIIGQLGVGMLIDHFGVFDVSVRHMDGSRVVAVISMIMGGYLMAR